MSFKSVGTAIIGYRKQKSRDHPSALKTPSNNYKADGGSDRTYPSSKFYNYTDIDGLEQEKRQENRNILIIL